MLTTIVLILGIGAVILVHELGHFLAARRAGVRVETFSIGFGPRLLKFKRGDTLYCLSLIPLGGYVKMAGDAVGDGSGASDELNSKPVGARFSIFIAGVVMNFLFAVALFSVVYAVGVPFRVPVIGKVMRGGPAWEAGMPEGAEVVRIDGKAIRSFPEISVAVALGGSELRIEAIPPGKTESQVYLVRPVYEPTSGFRQILVDGAVEEHVILHVEPNGPAERAGLRSGDRLLAIDDVPVSGRTALDLPTAEESGRPRRVTVAPSDGPGDEPKTVEIVPTRASGPPQIGVQTALRRVRALRDWVPAVKRSGLARGDILLEAAGRAIFSQEDLESALDGAQGEVTLRILRPKKEEGAERLAALDLALTLESPQEARAFVDAVALDSDRTVVAPRPATPAAAAGLLEGDRVLRVNAAPVADWNELRAAIASSGLNEMTLEIERNGASHTFRLSATPAALEDFGFRPMVPYLHKPIKASGPFAATIMGFKDSVGMLKQIYLSLKRVLAGQVAARNLGGPVMIVTTSHDLIQQGIWKFLWFLAVISVNLAFLNVLPIPVLDGGHLTFLLIEKIKGSPVSERFMVYAQVSGLVLILGLVVFVTYNDILRLLPTSFP